MQKEILTSDKIINISEGFDRVGRIILIKNEPEKIFRIIANDYRAFFETLFQNKNLNRLFQTGLVNSKISEKYLGANGEMVIEHDKLPDINYLFEWSREMTKRAGLFLLELTMGLVKTGLFCKDSHAFNIVFSGSRPFFHDYGSIEKNLGQIKPVWINAFFENFVFPVNYFQVADGKKYREFAIRHLNKPFNVWRFFYFTFLGHPIHTLRSIIHYFRLKKLGLEVSTERKQLEFLQRLRDYLGSLKLVYPQTKWGHYSDDVEKKLSDPSLWDVKMKNFAVLSQSIQPASLLDIGGNNGFYSRIFLRGHGGVKKITLVDYDEVAVDRAYLNEKDIANAFVGDFKRLTSQTITYFKPYKKTVYSSFASRNATDATLMLALMHHLVYYQNRNFAEIVEVLKACSKKWTIVEFVSNEDFHVKKWFKKGNIKKFWYTVENLTAELEKYFFIKKILPSANSREDRYLML